MYYLQTASIALVSIWIFFFLILIQRSPKDGRAYKTKYFRVKMAIVSTVLFGPSVVMWIITTDATDKVPWYVLSFLVPLTTFLFFRTKTANNIFYSFIDKRDI